MRNVAPCSPRSMTLALPSAALLAEPIAVALRADILIDQPPKCPRRRDHLKLPLLLVMSPFALPHASRRGKAAHRDLRG